MADLSLRALDRRLGTDGPAALLDDAVALIRAEPQLYLAGLPGALVLGAAVTAFVLLHRTLWLAVPLGELILPRTLPAALAVLLAFGLRGMGHGLVARRVATVLGRGRSGPWRPLSLFAAAVFVPAAALPAGLALLLPGLWVAGRFTPLLGFVGVRDRSVAQGVKECLDRPRAEGWRSAGVLAITALFVLALMVNLLLGSLLGVQALRMLTGADTTGLARLASPGNEGFFVGAAVLAAVLIDPILAVTRGLITLSASDDLGSRGLAHRWRDHLAGLSRLSLFCAIGLPLAAPAPALAVEPQSVNEWVERTQEASDRITRLAVGWEGAETIVLAPLVPIFEESLSGSVLLPSGQVIEVRGRWLIDALPEKIDSPEAVAVALRVAARLELAGVEAAMLTAEPRPGLSPQRALADELSAGLYRLQRDPQGRATVARPGLKQRLRAWWDALFVEDDPAPEPSSPAEEVGTGQWLVGLIAAATGLGLLGLLGLLLRSTAEPTARPRRRSLGTRGADPRSRPSSTWLSDADRAASDGAFDRAVHLAYLAVLAHEDARGHIEATPGAANGEHVQRFRGSSSHAARFARVTLAFDRLRYGDRPVEHADWLDLRERARSIAADSTGRDAERPR